MDIEEKARKNVRKPAMYLYKTTLLKN